MFAWLFPLFIFWFFKDWMRSWCHIFPWDDFLENTPCIDSSFTKARVYSCCIETEIGSFFKSMAKFLNTPDCRNDLLFWISRPKIHAAWLTWRCWFFWASYVCARALADGTSPAKRLQTEEFLGQQASNRSLLLWLHKCILYIAYLFLCPMMRIQYPVWAHFYRWRSNEVGEESFSLT